MTFPAFLFSFFVASLFGSLMHLWKDGGFGRLILYLVLSWIGFALGQWLGNVLSVRFIEVGAIHLGFGILGTLALLAFGYWLSLVDLNQ
jgi:hypothetical protein